MTDDAFPTRPNAHQLEELSERFFRSSLPRNWTCERPAAGDYGVDLRVELFEDDRATGREFLVQLKSSAERSGNDTEVVELKVTTYNYLRDKLSVVILVKFIESDNEAYWLFLRDVPSPAAHHKTFSVHIPRTNRLSADPWPVIQDHVHLVTRKKLAANRP
jgi:hypothetical protein